MKYNNILLIRAGYRQKNVVSHPIHIPPSLALKYTQEILKQQGVTKSQIFDFLIKDFTIEEITEYIQNKAINLALVEISSSASQQQAIEICKGIKSHSPIFIIGVGADVSERPQPYLEKTDLFDVIIRGEFEEEVCRLIKNLNDNTNTQDIIKLYRETKSHETFIIQDLNNLPQILWSKEEAKKYVYRYPLKLSKRILSGYVCTSRGCKHQCTFCSPSVRKSFGHKLRLRDAKKVVDEISYLAQQGINIISFEDDDFTGSPAHVNAICDEILQQKISINWVCHARIDEVSPAMLTKMHEAGCILILFGIESGSPRILELLHKTSQDIDWREKAKASFQAAQKAGISACAMFLVGNISESGEDIESSIKLAIELKPDFIKVHNFTLYPGSKDYAKYHKGNSNISVAHHYHEPIFNVSALDLNTLKKAQIIFYKRFLFRFPFILSHLKSYLLFYLINWSWSGKLLKDIFLYLIFTNKKKRSEPLNKESF